MNRLQRQVVAQLESVTGRHDEPSVYGGCDGDVGLMPGGPSSISWEINGDVGAIAVAGLAAIVMEVLHPSVMAGVETQSTYRTQPLRRAQNTMGYVVRTTFGSTSAATTMIERVKRMHATVNGVRPDGVAYRALDPELIAWVHTCIPWAILSAYDRYNRRLSVAEKDAYLREQAVVGRMSGAEVVPETYADLTAYVEEMRPLMAFNEQTRSFVEFLCGDTGDAATSAPAREQRERRFGLKASMQLMPAWARKLTGLDLPAALRPLADAHNALIARTLRWAYGGPPPFKAMAMERAAS